MTEVQTSRPDWNESDRLAALAQYEIMDTPAEGEFDDLVRVAAQVCGVPMALVSLIDHERQWFKAALGIETKETSREIAFCAHAIQQHEVFVVEDASKDERFAENPLVTGDNHLRFYAGAPLETTDGLPLGTLCVLDTKPRELNDDQKFALAALARQVMSRMELRRALSSQRANEARHRQILESALDYAIISMDLKGVVTSWNEGAHRILGWSEAEMCGRRCDDFFTPEDRAAGVPEREMGAALTHDRGSDERWHIRKDGARFWASGEMMPLSGADGAPIGFLKILRDRTEFRQAQEALRASEEAAERDRRLLVRELEHRVKNTLSLAQAIVSQSLRTMTSPAEARKVIDERLVSLGRAHDILTESNWAAAPISTVIANATNIHVADQSRIAAAGPDFNVSARAAVGLSMALHELCTNAVKYGALSNATGHVEIQWSTSGEPGAAVFNLTWRESGGPPVVPPSRKGFGSRLIQASLSGETNQQNSVEYLATGLVWHVEAPMFSIEEQQ